MLLKEGSSFELSHWYVNYLHEESAGFGSHSDKHWLTRGKGGAKPAPVANEESWSEALVLHLRVMLFGILG